MAKYVIFNPANAVYKIAETDAEKDAIVANSFDLNPVIISDAQFSSLKKGIGNQYIESFDGTTITWGSGLPDGPVVEGDENATEQNYKDQINLWKSQISEWLGSNESHPDYTKWNTYFNYLDNFDYNSITFPTTTRLEDYLEANTTWYNPLQLP